MKFKFQNIKAFTIWELLVSMLLVSLLVTFTYTMFIQGQKLIHHDQKAQEQLDQFIQLNKKIYDIVNNSEIIECNQNQILFFEGDTLVELISVLDRAISFSNRDFFLDESYPIDGINLTYLKNSINIVNKIEINVKGMNGNFFISISKVYSKEMLIKLNNYEH